MTNIKQLSEKMALDAYKMLIEKNSKFAIYKDEILKISEFTLQSCLDLFSKQSGEYRTCLIAEFEVKGKKQLGFAYCEKDELPPEIKGHNHIKFIDHAALLSSNAKIEYLKDCDLKQLKEIAALQQRVKELESDVKASQNAHFKAAESFKQMSKKYDEVNSQLQEAVEVIENLLEAHEDTECRLDHHGLCQEHYLESDCSVKKARSFLTKLKGGG